MKYKWNSLKTLAVCGGMAATLSLSVSANALAAEGCNFKTSDHLEAMADIAAIERVEIEIKKYQKWTINGLRILTDRSENIKANRKKNFKADVTVVYPFGTCTYDAKVRQNGDWKDHIIYANESAIVQSLNVKMREGNLAHFVRFKLLLPHTRQSENEIIFSSLLHRLGYLSPRSKMVDTDVNGVKYKMLLQESAAKEFLEANLRREGPLFEGDEQLIWGWGGYDLFGLEPVSLSRLVNDKWAAAGDSSISIAQTAFSKLQEAYMRFSNGEIGGTFIDWNLITNGSEQAIEKWAVYEILVLAAGGSHALRPTNRQFFWNAFEENFEPVYYDGNIQLTYDLGYGGKELEKYATVLKPEHFAKAKELLAGIDHSEFAAKMQSLGVDKGSDEIQLILERLSNGVDAFQQQIRQFEKADPRGEFTASERDRFQSRLAEMVPGALVGSIETMDFQNGTAKLKLCNIKRDACGAEDIPFARLAAFMSGDYFVGDQPAMITQSMVDDHPELQTASFDDGKIKIRATKSTKIDYNSVERSLTVSQTQPDDWALVHDGKIEDLNVTLVGLNAAPFNLGDGQRFNRFGLTGCLNFYQSKLNRVSISATDGTCEDSVNLVSSSGELDQLSVERSFADAIDIDFSKISIKNVSVTDAGNDCLDVSSGHYQVGNVDLTRCGDKGISVGEASKFFGQNVIMDGGAIGVSSKDSSLTEIKNMTAINTELCAEAFKKKQEFFGGKLVFKNFTCEKNTYNADANSQIIVEGAIQ